MSPKYSAQFANAVSWQKVDANGLVVEEEDDITQGNDNVDPNSGSGSGTGGGSTGGDDGME